MRIIIHKRTQGREQVVLVPAPARRLAPVNIQGTDRAVVLRELAETLDRLYPETP